MNFVWFIGLFCYPIFVQKDFCSNNVFICGFCIPKPIVLRKELNTTHNVHEHINPVAQKNQDAFCTALFQLLLKKPLEKISVTELCHMADLDRTTFYRSFESKDDVLDYYLDRQMTLLAGQLPAYSTLEKNLTALFRWTYAERKNLCILMDCHLTSFFSDALSEKIILVLISNIEFGDARQFVPWPVSLPGENRYFRNSFIGAYMGFFNSWRYGNFAERPEDLAKCMASFYLH